MRCFVIVAGVIVMLLVTSQGLPANQNLDSEIREVLVELIKMELEDKRANSEVRRESEEDDGNVEDVDDVDDVDDVKEWLKRTNEKLRVWQNKQALVEWNYNTNITDYNSKQISEVEAQYSAWYPDVQKKARSLRKRGLQLDPDTDRQLRFLSKYANPSNIEDARHIKELEANMSGIYSTSRVNMGRDELLDMEPGLQKLMATSRHPDGLRQAWVRWRDATGPKIKPLYVDFVNSLNVGARENGYSDYGEYWRDHQFDETPDLEEMCERLWQELRPLYLQLHAYVRRKLIDKYGEEEVGYNGTIAAHLLGNMWAQNWQMISDIVFPPPSKNYHSISTEAETNLKKHYDVKKLFKLSEEFYSSIGLFNMTDAFWEKSMLVRPADREVTCHASATDLYSKDDFRIKMCTEVTMDYLYTIHHEMGHVQYFMSYAPLPTVYRTGANAGFHEAVGDTMALSVITRKHLVDLGLIHNQQTSDDDSIYDLLYMALSKVAFLPYGYLLDKWRWRVFDGAIPQDRMNEEYWKLRLKYQGIVSPVPRSEADFDPAAKFHVPANSPYMIYFISFVVQFQFYESMCELSGHEGALHTCDFYRSQEAGLKFREMLELGQSEPWPHALEKLTGSRDISVGPLLRYFKPLHDWLVEQNKGHNLGWEEAIINWKH